MEFYDPNKDPNRRSDSFSNERKRTEMTGLPNERGGCLTFYLVVTGIIGVIGIFLSFSLITDPVETNTLRQNDTSMLQLIGFIAIGFGFVKLACIAGLWNYKRWGYQGLLLFAGLTALLNLCTGDLIQMIGNVVNLGILYALVNPISDILE
ncbi:MAG: hypothetical protein RLP44_16380 [Aggregatilineales bacterium]